MENRKRDEELEGRGEEGRREDGGRGREKRRWGGWGDIERGKKGEEGKGGREEEKIISPLEWYDSRSHHPLASIAHRSVEQCC